MRSEHPEHRFVLLGTREWSKSTFLREKGRVRTYQVVMFLLGLYHEDSFIQGLVSG